MKSTMKLNKMIKTAENFQYAINIAYDFTDQDKIKNYIPTNDAIRIIEDVLLSIKVNSNDRARLFIGAYGKGKSHLALMLIALVYKKDVRLFENLLTKIKTVNKELYAYIRDYIKSDNRLLPVVVEGNKFSLQQSLLSALNNALERENMVDIMPNTYFSVAVDTIDLWKSNYKSTYIKFSTMITSSVNEFLKRLNNFEQEALTEFSKIYPDLTAGSKFSPILNSDVISLYSDVIEEIKQYGYNGIFLIYDEFSKYLEGNVNSTTATDIKVLQDFAEKANRSGHKQLHLLMISHKNIINYVDELPKVKIDAWKAVSERFKTIELSNSPAQLYDLISHVLIKDKKLFQTFYKNNKVHFDSVLNSYTNRNMFAGISKEELNKIIIGCYPLEPTSLFMLPSISEKVAQNERSMFTFLSSKNDKNALFNLLKSDLSFITPDYIFDYFEEQFKNEAYTTDIYKLWKLVVTSINLLSKPDELQIKLIKCLALIYILDKKEIIKPTSDNLLLIYSDASYDKNKIISKIDELKEIGIFKYSSRTQYLRLSERTDINIDDILKDMIERRKPTFNALKILNEEAKRVFLYPNRYNDTNEIIRYFTFEFITSDQCIEVDDWNKRIEDKYAAGTFFAIYNSKMEINQSWIENVTNNRVLFGLPNNQSNIEEVLKQYDALSILIENSDDEFFKEELLYVFEDVTDLLNKYIESYINPYLGEVTYYYLGKKIGFTRKSQLSNHLTKICNKLYIHTPVIINEVINKNNVTKQAINSRNKVIEGLLENKIKQNLGLSGNGQDMSFFRSIIKNKGIYIEDNGNYSIVTENLHDENLNHVLKVIKEFILSTTVDGSKNVGTLYNQLTDVTHGIGIKSGIIPLLFSAVLHHFKRFVVISKKNKELPITVSLLDSINKNPSQYELILESWSKEKEDYINALEDAFNSFLFVGEKEYNTFDYIVKAMQRWFFRLSKYAKEADIVIYKSKLGISAKSVKRFRQSLKSPEINSREFLFEKLPQIFGVNIVNGELADNVNKAKETLDMLIIDLQNDIEELILNKLANGKDDKRPLYSLAKDWYEALEQKTKEHFFTNGEGKLLSIIGNINNDITGIIKKIGRELSGLHIEDWNNDTFDKVKITLSNQIESIISFNNSKSDIEHDSLCKIILRDEEGKEVVKTLDETEVSRRGKMLYNEIISSISEYGNALSEGEKRQILINVIMDYLK